MWAVKESTLILFFLEIVWVPRAQRLSGCLSAPTNIHSLTQKTKQKTCACKPATEHAMPWTRGSLIAVILTRGAPQPRNNTLECVCQLCAQIKTRDVMRKCAPNPRVDTFSRDETEDKPGVISQSRGGGGGADSWELNIWVLAHQKVS